MTADADRGRGAAQPSFWRGRKLPQLARAPLAHGSRISEAVLAHLRRTPRAHLTRASRGCLRTAHALLAHGSPTSEAVIAHVRRTSRAHLTCVLRQCNTCLANIAPPA